MEQGIRDIAEMKDADDELTSFIDTNLAVNSLSTTAKKINNDFQTYIEEVVSRYGDYKAGPVKEVARCQSKLQQDYKYALYPKAARLVDLLRCSVSFNTVEQLLAGFEEFMLHIERADVLELARVKNGFLEDERAAGRKGAYRDIKVNVIYHLQPEDDEAEDVSMICEVQFILNQYLYEKKRNHKLYAILRDREFFDAVVEEEEVANVSNVAQTVKSLTFEPILNVKEQVKIDEVDFGKCSSEPELRLSPWKYS